MGQQMTKLKRSIEENNSKKSLKKPTKKLSARAATILEKTQ